jgi:F-type H+/Na+-transporting ATPase subunit beta
MDKIEQHHVGKVVSINGQVVVIECTSEFRPALRELLTDPANKEVKLEVHSYRGGDQMYCLLLSPRKDIKRNMDIVTTGTQLTIPVGKSVLGRVFGLYGNTEDGGEPISESVERRSIYGSHEVDQHQMDVSVANVQPEDAIVETGIKAIDFFTPLPRGGKMGLVGGPGVGKTVLMTEIMRNVNSQGNGLSIFAGIGERIREGHDLWRALAETEVLYRTALIIGHMNENAAVRFKIGAAAATIAEYFRDVEKQNVLFFVDNIFRFAQAGSELSTLLGDIPSEFGYQPTLQTEISQLESRLRSTDEASITAIQTIYAPADMITNPVITATMPHLAAVIILSRDIAHRGRFPAIDVIRSKSSVMERDLIGEDHYEVLTKTIEIFNRYERLSRIAAIIGEEELSVEDRKTYQRAEKILAYMTQPFFTAAPQTGRKGAFVQRTAAVRDVKLILQGRFDAVPTEQLNYIGDLQGAGFSRFI